MKHPPRAVHYEKDGYHYYRPTTLEQVHIILNEQAQSGGLDNVRLVGGNTSIGVYDRFVENPHVLIDISQLDALHGIDLTDDELIVGSAVTYSDFLGALDRLLADPSLNGLPDRRAGVESMRYMARRTAGTIVRNAATLAGQHDAGRASRRRGRAVPVRSVHGAGLARRACRHQHARRVVAAAAAARRSRSSIRIRNRFRPACSRAIAFRGRAPANTRAPTRRRCARRTRIRLSMPAAASASPTRPPRRGRRRARGRRRRVDRARRHRAGRVSRGVRGAEPRRQALERATR